MVRSNSRSGAVWTRLLSIQILLGAAALADAAPPSSIVSVACQTDPCFASVVSACGSCFPTTSATVRPEARRTTRPQTARPRSERGGKEYCTASGCRTAIHSSCPTVTSCGHKLSDVSAWSLQSVHCRPGDPPGAMQTGPDRVAETERIALGVNKTAYENRYTRFDTLPCSCSLR